MTMGPAASAKIKIKVRAIIRRGDDVLLSYAIDPASGVRYGRFLGGAIEFGERAEDTVRRELHEEIGFELGNVSPLGVVEDVCEWDGRLHHEITFVFAATFALAAEIPWRQKSWASSRLCRGERPWGQDRVSGRRSSSSTTARSC